MSHTQKQLLSFFFGLTCFLALVAPLYQVSAQMPDPLGLDVAAETGLRATDPRIIVGRIINVALGLLGTVAICLIIYAGFLYMTAGGNSDNIDKAKSILITAVIGLIIILSAYTITRFALRNVYQATQGAPYGGADLF